MKLKSIIRRLTPVECSRLMGFCADDYLDIEPGVTPDSPRYKACGNSWGVNSAEFVNVRIEKALRECGAVDTSRSIVYGTTCSGVEAHSQAVRNAAWNAKFFSEIEPFPCKVLAARYPHVPNLGDMTKVDGTKYDLDVFSGGTPCQSLSVAGKRHGMAEGSGTRSSLAFHWLRIAQESNAKVTLLENVPGAFSVNDGRDFAWFVWRIMEAGYGVAWRVMDVQYDFSFMFPRAIPQRRRRIWLVAAKDGNFPLAMQILFERSRFTGTAHPKRVLNDGTVIDDEQPAQDDLFASFATPFFTKASRADWIPLKAIPKKFDINLHMLLRECGEVRYNGEIFGKGAEHTPEGIDLNLLENLGAGAGVACGTRIATLTMPEWPAGLQLPWGEKTTPDAFNGTVCGLSDILLPWGDYLGKYLLSKRACEGIVRRAEKRGKNLPKVLQDALSEQIGNWTQGFLDKYLAKAGLISEDECEEGDDSEDDSDGEGYGDDGCENG